MTMVVFMEVHDNFPDCENAPATLRMFADYAHDKNPAADRLVIVRHGEVIARIDLKEK